MSLNDDTLILRPSTTIEAFTSLKFCSLSLYVGTLTLYIQNPEDRKHRPSNCFLRMWHSQVIEVTSLNSQLCSLQNQKGKKKTQRNRRRKKERRKKQKKGKKKKWVLERGGGTEGESWWWLLEEAKVRQKCKNIEYKDKLVEKRE